MILGSAVIPAAAGNANPDIRSGNKLYEDGKFTESEIEYRKGIDTDDKSVESRFNLGNSLYRQEKYEDAALKFKEAADLSDDKQQISSAYHNMGNALYKAENYAGSVEAYKNALKAVPEDEETRFNLALAQKKLKFQQPQQNQQQNQQEQQQEQQQQEEMSKDAAEQILDAFSEKEEETREKLQPQRGQRRLEKDW